jgi:hypothetical protein
MILKTVLLRRLSIIFNSRKVDLEQTASQFNKLNKNPNYGSWGLGGI